MSANVRFSVSGFVTPVDAEAIKHGLKEAIRQIEQGQELHKQYKMPDIPTASLITLAFRNSYKAYREGMLEELREKINGPGEESNSSQEGQSVRGSDG